jgi:hypothetical protein
MIRFAVIFEGRNGSSHLISLLNSHPSVLCYPEILVPLTAAQQAEAIRAVAGQEDVRAVSAYAGADRYHVAGFAAKWGRRPFAAIGFKTKITDLRHVPDTMLALGDRGFRLIYLKRYNILKSVVSDLNAARLQMRHDGISNASRPDQVQGGIHVDFAEFERRLYRRQLAESLHRWFFDSYDLPKLALAYEDLLADETGTMAALCDFIAVERRALSSTFLKNTPPLLSEAVLNYDAFADRLKNSEHARFLD